jgi:hypothetical protein
MVGPASFGLTGISTGEKGVNGSESKGGFPEGGRGRGEMRVSEREVDVDWGVVTRRKLKWI